MLPARRRTPGAVLKNWETRRKWVGASESLAGRVQEHTGARTTTTRLGDLQTMAARRKRVGRGGNSPLPLESCWA
jgi:hypothetical protein